MEHCRVCTGGNPSEPKDSDGRAGVEWESDRVELLANRPPFNNWVWSGVQFPAAQRMQDSTAACPVEAEVSTGEAVGLGDWIPRDCFSEPVSSPLLRCDKPGRCRWRRYRQRLRPRHWIRNQLGFLIRWRGCTLRPRHWNRNHLGFFSVGGGVFYAPDVGLETAKVFFSIVGGVPCCVRGRLVLTDARCGGV